MRAHLVGLIARFPEPEATDLLLDWACDPAPEAPRREALWGLADRLLERPLREDEVAVFWRRLDQGDALASACSALVLAKATPEMDDLGAETARRFRGAVGRDVSCEPILASAWVPPRHAVLRRFLDAFVLLGMPARLELADASQAWPTGAEVNAWRVLALAATGDRSQAAAVRDMLTEHVDPYLRAVAVPVYAHLAGTESVTLLKSLCEDSFVGQYGRHTPDHPVYPIRRAAQQALARLAEP